MTVSRSTLDRPDWYSGQETGSGPFKALAKIPIYKELRLGLQDRSITALLGPLCSTCTVYRLYQLPS